MSNVTVTVQLPQQEAWALAQFLKRAGHYDYLRCAANEDEAYNARYAGDKVADALRESGVNPR